MYPGWARLSDAERLILLSMAYVMVQRGKEHRGCACEKDVRETSGIEDVRFRRVISKLRGHLLIHTEGSDHEPDKRILSFTGAATAVRLNVELIAKVQITRCP